MDGLEGEGGREGGVICLPLEGLESGLGLAVAAKCVESSNANVEAAVGPVRRIGDIASARNKVGMVQAGVHDWERCQCGSEIKNRDRGNIVHETVNETETRNTTAVRKRVEVRRNTLVPRSEIRLHLLRLLVLDQCNGSPLDDIQLLEIDCRCTSPDRP